MENNYLDQTVQSIDASDIQAARAWSELTQNEKVDLLLDAIGDLEKELKDIKFQISNHQHLSGYSVVVNQQ